MQIIYSTSIICKMFKSLIKNKTLGWFLNEINEKLIKIKIPPTFRETPGYLNPLLLLIISYFFIIR